MTALDVVVERLGRRLAARTTRRTFLSRAAQVGVLVAGGPALATLLVDRAEARVCGQSGVSPKCPTYDCNGPDDVWGWCWYASPGCCAGGGLKKICDCCTRDWPNVHGYCPSGHNIRCMAESCHDDPRVMYVPVLRAPGLTGPSVATARSRLTPGEPGGSVVIGESDDTVLAALAGSVAGAIDAPLLLTPRTRLAAAVLAEVQRRRATAAVVMGSLAPGIDDELRSYGVTVERVGAGADAGAMSLATAAWLRTRVGPAGEAVCIEPTGQSASVAAAAAALAGNQRLPLLIGVDAAIAFGAPATWLIGAEPAARAGEVAGARPIGGGDREELAVAVASVTTDHYLARDVTVHLVPAGAPDVTAGLAGGRGVVLIHPPGSLGGPLYGWLNARRSAVRQAVVAGTFGRLGDQGIYDTQGALNHFDPHLLIGVSGQGLPVRSQPDDERVPGRARVAGVLPELEPPYWSSRATLKRPRLGGE